MKQQQQGDVWLKKIDKLPMGCKEIAREGILAYGEVTGHKHQLSDTNIKILEKNGRTFIKVDEKVQLKHEEHHTQIIEPGIWEFGQVREKDWVNGMVGKVID